METVNVLKQMAKYDLSAPIAITMIFEDSDDDSILQNALSKNNNMDDNNRNKVSAKRSKTQTLKTNKSSANKKSLLKKTMLSLKETEELKKRKSVIETSEKHCDIVNNRSNVEIMSGIRCDLDYYYLQNNSNVNQRELFVIGDDTLTYDESPPTVNQTDEPVTMFVEDLLHKLSQHIVLIMQSFYHYSLKQSNPQDNIRNEKIFHFIKSHFFELSYTTTESILLPQEQNERFINQFLDNTAQTANSKSLQWKCNRGDVQPFLEELMSWTKQKRNDMKRNSLLQSSNPSNENVMLKQQLTRPLQPIVSPHSDNVTESSVAPPQTHLCVFSSGSPGHEISINIDADTFIQLTERQSVSTERNATNSNTISRNTSVAPPPPPYGRHYNEIQKNKPKHVRHPPPYTMNHNSKKSTYRPPPYNKNNVNPNQNYHIRPPHQNHPSNRPPTQNYPTQVNYISTNQTSPTDDRLNPMLYDNMNNNTPMHGTHYEQQVTSSPVITNASSLNPKTRVLSSRCYMCGKNTITSCDPYNPPCRPTYCSFLCQELDGQYYKQMSWKPT